MTVLVYLIPIALALGLIALFAFLWALKSGQYDDMEGEAARILFDEDAPPQANKADEKPGEKGGDKGGEKDET